MTSIESEKKLVLFGAGKIGRSFIGPLFSQSGYKVVFIDKDESLIHELNERKSYNLIIKSDASDQVLNISNVRGVHAENLSSVENEIATAGILAVSVGINGLKSVFPQIAKGLLKRFDINREWPLDIIIAENLRDSDDIFRTELMKILPTDYPFYKLVGLIETSIGKMVPIMLEKDFHRDKLQVFAEPYNTLIVSKDGFKNPIPKIKGLAPKENIKAWVDRKLFIHNLGHVSAAYVGYLYNPGFVYLWEALNVHQIFYYVREIMLQASSILMKKYPNVFSTHELIDHIDDLLFRFRNKALGDTLFRVGCDLKRKLGAHDRLAAPIRMGLEFNLPYDKILFSMVCGIHFRAHNEKGNMLDEDVDFVNTFNGDIPQILTNISGFNRNEHAQLFHEAQTVDNQIRNLKFPDLLTI